MKHFDKQALSIAAVIATVCASASALAGGRADLVLAALESSKAQFVSGEVIVQMHRGISVESSRTFGNGVEHEMLIPGQGRNDAKGDLVLVKLPLGQMIKDVIRDSQGDATIDFVEPNWIYQHHATSNDTYYTSGTLWGMYGDGTSPANQYGSQAGEAWAAGHTCNSNTYIGIIDEGYMFDHEDLAANAWTNPFDPVNGVDDDGNGYVDDSRGWDFAGGDNSVFDGVNDDHGTHVAGTIAGAGGNGKGVAGVCWQAKLISAKFLGNRGGTTANAILAVDYLTDLKTRHGLNIVASNNSWGGGGFSQGLKDAIDRAGAADILFIAAAGNESNNNDANLSYPGSYTSSNIIAVASITSTGALSSFSNYGATTVDLGAPGSAIMSTVPKRVKGSMVSGYASYSGTSMATPHVSGGAALYASTHPGATAAQIKAAIMGAAVPTSSLSGKCVSGGRLNVSGF
jgi:subtilisin family serine protease